MYIIQENAMACIPGGWCIMKVGMDGAWVGAFKKTAPVYNSYVPVPVEPGKHHLCVSAQSGKDDMIVFAHFTAEAGKVYFLGIKGFNSESSRLLDIAPIDSDEAKYLIATSPLSVSQPRK